MRAIITVLALTGISALPASARTMTGLMTLNANRCEQAIVGRQTLPCGVLVNMAYDDKMNSFQFYTPKDMTPGKSLSFLGDGGRQVVFNNGIIEQPVVAVTVGVEQPGQKPAMRMINAVGTCRFGKPYGNEIIEVSCNATSAEGTFKGNFQSDGQPPKVMNVNQRK